MAWNRAEASLPGGKAAVDRMMRARAREDKEYDRIFAERGWRPLDEWDLEELLKGCPRNEDGSWPHGPRPRWIEPWLVKELNARFHDQAARQLMGLVPAALAVFESVLKDPDVDTRLRLDAAKFIAEQIFGRAPQKIIAQVSEKASTFLAARVVLDDGQDAHPVVTGEIVDDDEDSSGER